MKSIILSILVPIAVFIYIFIVMLGFVKGQKGNPIYFQTELDTQLGGPFEASNSSARYALTEAIVKYKTFFLNRDLAYFSSPDVTDYKGKFMSIFTPGVSFLGIPFYFAGYLFKIPQLFTYFSTVIIAILNVLLIAKISQKLGSSFIAGLMGGLAFLFATNGLAYSLTFTQHHLTVFLILLAILNSLGERTLWKNIAFGAILGYGLMVDIPNAFFLAPFGIYILIKSIAKQDEARQFKLKIKLNILGVIAGLLPLLLVFGWYNHVLTGSFTKLGQTIGRSKVFRQGAQPRLSAEGATTTKDQNANISILHINLPFETRPQLDGLYILLLSDERSWIYYGPIVFIGLTGLILAYRKKENQVLITLILTVVLLDIVMYASFSDPWGGWAFGARYLIPASAMLCIGMGSYLDRFKKKPFYIALFFIILLYSVWVNSLGALTTAAIPPKVEAVNLPSHIPYTYKYNEQLMAKNFSSSLVYNLFFAGRLSSFNYMLILIGETFGTFILLYVLMLL